MKDREGFELRAKQLASGMFLTQNFPDSWDEMSKERKEEFVEDNIWEPFEGIQASEIIEYIDSHSDAIIRFIAREGFIEKI